MNIDRYDVIIIGGSYAGLSAGMALGRALRNVLIIDSGKPCNRQTPHSHNFLTQDGNTPKAIWATSREQVAKYSNVQFWEGVAVAATQTKEGFEVTTDNGAIYITKKLIFATGIQDIMPQIEGFAACWGISVLHCPYCHGYEIRNEKTGILANGDMGFEFSRLIHNWTKKLTLLTNGNCELSNEQINALTEHNIEIVEKVIVGLEQVNGHITNVLFADGTKEAMKAIYARVPFVQNSPLPEMLGCELTETGHIKVDAMQKTTVNGIYACGDNTTPMRTVSVAVSMGTMAGAIANSELIKDEF